MPFTSVTWVLKRHVHFRLRAWLQLLRSSICRCTRTAAPALVRPGRTPRPLLGGLVRCAPPWVRQRTAREQKALPPTKLLGAQSESPERTAGLPSEPLRRLHPKPGDSRQQHQQIGKSLTVTRRRLVRRVIVYEGSARHGRPWASATATSVGAAAAGHFPC